ncbi:MAG: ArnT family glycosyltransferase [Puniceicoccales bacterium]
MSDSPAKMARLYRWASLMLFAGVAVMSLWTLPDYGMCWDEFYRWEGGQQKLGYYRALLRGEDGQALLLDSADAYPGFFDLSVALLDTVLPFGLLAIGHGMSLVFGLAALGGTWAIGRYLGGDRLGFWAVLFLLLMPRFYGQIFFNPKDVPFAAGMIWSLYFLLRWGRCLPRPRLGPTLMLGVVLGLTLALRIGGLVLFAYMGGYATFVLLRELLYERVPTKRWLMQVLQVAIHALIVLGVALVVLYPWWPYIHSNPLSRIYETFTTVEAYPWKGTVLFQGSLDHGDDIPWYYVPTWLVITLPEYFFFTTVVGLGLLLVNWRRAATYAFSVSGFPWVVIAVAAFFPVLYVIIRDSVLYNGIRHLMFVLPPLACLSAWAWVCFWDWIAGRRALKCAAGGILVLLIAMELVVLQRLHPYEYVYFNQFSGGMSSKAGRYTSDYWGISLLEAVRWLEEYVPEGDYKIEKSLASTRFTLYLPERFHLAEPENQPDFDISLTRSEMDVKPEGETIYTVERYGFPMAVVKDLRASPIDSANAVD